MGYGFFHIKVVSKNSDKIICLNLQDAAAENGNGEPVDQGDEDEDPGPGTPLLEDGPSEEVTFYVWGGRPLTHLLSTPLFTYSNCVV